MDPRYRAPSAAVEDQPQDTFRDLDRLTASLRWLLYAGAVLAAIAVVSAWLQLDLLSRPYTVAEGHSNDVREAAVGRAELLLTLISIVVFGRWILLAHRNLPALGARALEFKPGWAVGWFFIPLANLWKPYEAMSSLWRSSRNVDRPNAPNGTWLLPTWWTLWIVSNVTGNIVFQLGTSAHSVRQLLDVTRINIASCAADVLLYPVAALLVGRIWEAQRAQRERRIPDELGLPDAART